ncbi:hypothetical protein RFI_03763, partial [Reticulomyxa filosa]
QKVFGQIFNHLTSRKTNSRFYWDSMRNTFDPIVARLCFHFFSIQQQLKYNSFRLLFEDSELFLSQDASSSSSSSSSSPTKEPVPYYCANRHPLLLEDAPLSLCKEATVKWMDAEPKVEKHLVRAGEILYVAEKNRARDSESINVVVVTLAVSPAIATERRLHPTGQCKAAAAVEMRERGRHSCWKWLSFLDERFSEKFAKWYPHGSSYKTLKDMYEFEEKLDCEYRTFFNDKDKFIKYRNAGEDARKRQTSMAFGELMSEIEEKKELTNSYQISCAPQLFLAVQVLSWNDLSRAFSYDSKLCAQYPLTAQLLACNEDSWVIQYLPSIAKLLKHVHDEYSQQLLPEQLYDVHIKDIVKQKRECYSWWSDLYLQNHPTFAREHNRFLHTLCRLKRLSVHEHKKDDDDNNKNDNDDDNKGEREITLYDNDQVTYKWLFDVTSNDVLCFDKNKLNEIIRRHSAPVLEYGAINSESKYFDFASIENDIYHSFVHGRRPLALGVPLFQYRNDLDIHNSIATIETQHQDSQTAQIELLWEHTRLYTASSLQKQKGLEALNDVVVFLSNNLDQLFDTPLINLLQRMHFEEKDWSLFDFQIHIKDKKNVLCIKHVAALWRFLNNLMRIECLDESSITPFVLEIYRYPLSNELQQQIKAFVKKTPLTTMKDILRVWREIAYKLGQVQRNPPCAQEFQLAFLLRHYLRDNDLRHFPHEYLEWRFCATAYHCAYQEWKKKDERPASSWFRTFLSNIPFF